MSTNSTASLDEHELALEEAIEEASQDEQAPCSPAPASVPGKDFTRANLKNYPPAATVLFHGKHSEVENDELTREERAVQDQVMTGAVYLVMMVSLGVVMTFNLRIPAEAPILAVYNCGIGTGSLRCTIYEINNTYRLDSLSWAYLGLHLFESFLCSVVASVSYKRMLQTKSNPLRDLLSACSFSLLHVQLAIVVGYMDPRMFCMFIVLTICSFIFNSTAHDARRGGYGYPNALAFSSCMLWVVQWVLLFLGLNSVSGNENVEAFIVASVLLFVFEIGYIYVAYIAELSQCQRERRILIAGCMIRSLMAWTIAFTLPEPKE